MEGGSGLLTAWLFSSELQHLPGGQEVCEEERAKGVGGMCTSWYPDNVRGQQEAQACRLKRASEYSPDTLVWLVPIYLFSFSFPPQHSSLQSKEGCVPCLEQAVLSLFCASANVIPLDWKACSSPFLSLICVF